MGFHRPDLLLVMLCWICTFSWLLTSFHAFANKPQITMTSNVVAEISMGFAPPEGSNRHWFMFDNTLLNPKPGLLWFLPWLDTDALFSIDLISPFYGNQFGLIVHMVSTCLFRIPCFLPTLTLSINMTLIAEQGSSRQGHAHWGSMQTSLVYEACMMCWRLCLR